MLVSFSPGDSMRLESPQTATQSLATIAAGGSQSVAWQIRAERTASATLTMTLRDSSGNAVGTVSRTMVITD